VITGGAVALLTADQCAATSYTTGQAVFIPAGVPHRVVNEGIVDADVVVNYTLRMDARRAVIHRRVRGVDRPRCGTID
jgi:uncharacterized protein YjlB